MKKKSKKLIGLLGIALIVLTLCVGGYTYAKYRTEVKGGGQVDIAKWSFKVDESSQKIETIKLSDTVDETLLVNGKVAPGTKGEFTIDIDGTGTEVGINYDVKFANETNKPTNFVYTYNGEKFNSLAKVAENLKGSILANDGLCICPNINLVSNIGFGKDATHCCYENDPLNNMVSYKIKGIITQPRMA